MEYSVLDIDDCQLKLWQGSELLLSSPGYALFENHRLIFGEAAQQQARIYPQNINHQYWSKLNTLPLENPLGQMRHNADIAHSHIQDISDNVDVSSKLILAVPSSYCREQLALLLGIIHESSFEVVGLVDKALVMALPQLSSDSAICADLQLHSIILSTINFSDHQWKITDQKTIPDIGWLTIQERIGNSIANAFIEQTRIDPRKLPVSEQALYNKIPDYLQTLENSDTVNISLSGQTSRISRETIASDCADIFNTIKKYRLDRGKPLLATTKLSMLPGFTEYFPQLTIAKQSNIPLAIDFNLHAVIGDSNALTQIKQLPPMLDITDRLTRPESRPSHLLYRHVAYPLDSKTTWIGNGQLCPKPCIDLEIDSLIAIEEYKGALTLKLIEGNDARINGGEVNSEKTLQTGDVVKLDGEQFTLIEVQTNSGP